MKNSNTRFIHCSLKALSLSAAMMGAGSSICAPVHAAGTENISYRDMTWHATMQNKFSREAAESVVWSSWIPDWYLADKREYRQDADRNALVMGMRPHIASIRMGDLKTSAQVNAALARVASGTFIGLLDAHERNDVAAAHNILGASLRSMHEFYVRSNWLSDANRKSLTFFEMPRAQRASVPLWTGASAPPAAEAQSPLGYSSGSGATLPPLPNPQASPSGDVTLAAVRHSMQWLSILERAMKKAGAGDFWNKVKTTAVDSTQRQLQYQTGSRVPYTFLTEPAGSATGDWWLRLQLQTGTDNGAGTDGNIIAKAGGKQFLLDWKHEAPPVETYDDFEAGKNDAYFIGPFDTLPTELELFNDSPSAVAGAFSPPLAVLGLVLDGIDRLNSGLNDLTGMNDDYVKTAAHTLTPQDLNNRDVAQRDFSIDLDGKDEGFYRVHGKLTRTGGGDHNTWVVQLTELECVRESKVDQLTASDEPYIMLNIQPLPGEPISWRNEPFKDVDKGERMAINYRSPGIKVHAGEGVLNIAVCVMEQDGSNHLMRDDALVRFANKMNERLPSDLMGWGLSLATGLTGDWKLDRMTVTAWNRSGGLRTGKLFNAPVGKWIKGSKTEFFPLSSAGIRNTGVTLDDLLPVWSEFQKQPEPQPQPQPTPTVPDTPAPPSFDISQWQGEWDTTMGRVKLTLEDDALRGRLIQKDELGRDREAERLELRGDGAKSKLAGTANYSSFQSQMTLTLSAEGDSFTGTFLPRGETKPRAWSGKRLRTNTTSTAPTKPTSPIVPPAATPSATPVVTTPVVAPPVVTPPVIAPPVTMPPTIPSTPAGAPAGNGKFYPLTNFDVRLDKVEVARDNSIHAFVTFKNPSNAERKIVATTMQSFLEDADGLAFSFGDITRATTPEPEPFDREPVLAGGGELKARFFLPTLKGGAPLRSLIVKERDATASFDLSDVSFSGQTAQPFTSAPGAVAEWKELGTFDVRFDGARPQRGSKFSEAFFTFRNLSAEMQKVFFVGGTFRITTTGPEGIVRDRGQLYSVRGLSPDSMNWQPWVMPGREIRLRFLLDGPLGSSLTIEHSGSGTKQTFAVG